MNFPDTQVDSAYSSAPEKIRDFIHTGKLAMSVFTIGKESSLAPEKVEALAVVLRNMMIGLIKPTDLGVELEERGFTKNEIGAIVQRIKEKVLDEVDRFVKVVNEEDVVEKVVSNAPLPKPLPTPDHELSAPKPIVMPPKIGTVPPSPIALTQKPTPLSQPIPRPTPTPSVKQVIPPTPAPRTAAPIPPSTTCAPAKPTLRTMIMDVEASTASKQGGQPSESPRPQASVPTTSAASSVRAPKTEDLHADLKKYGVDPYREPVE